MRVISCSTLEMCDVESRGYSPELCSLLQSTLSKDASARPSFKDLLTEPLIQSALEAAPRPPLPLPPVPPPSTVTAPSSAPATVAVRAHAQGQGTPAIANAVVAEAKGPPRGRSPQPSAPRSKPATPLPPLAHPRPAPPQSTDTVARTPIWAPARQAAAGRAEPPVQHAGAARGELCFGAGAHGAVEAAKAARVAAEAARAVCADIALGAEAHAAAAAVQRSFRRALYQQRPRSPTTVIHDYKQPANGPTRPTSGALIPIAMQALAKPPSRGLEAFQPTHVLAARREELRQLRAAEEAELMRRRSAIDGAEEQRAARRADPQADENLVLPALAFAPRNRPRTRAGRWPPEA